MRGPEPGGAFPPSIGVKDLTEEVAMAELGMAQRCLRRETRCHAVQTAGSHSSNVISNVMQIGLNPAIKGPP